MWEPHRAGAATTTTDCESNGFSTVENGKSERMEPLSELALEPAMEPPACAIGVSDEASVVPDAAGSDSILGRPITELRDLLTDADMASAGRASERSAIGAAAGGGVKAVAAAAPRLVPKRFWRLSLPWSDALARVDDRFTLAEGSGPSRAALRRQHRDSTNCMAS